MPIIIPELILKNISDGILSTLADDIRNRNDLKSSLLHRIFGDLKYGGIVYKDQAANIFGKDNGAARKLKTKLAYDGDVSEPPIIFITNAMDSFNLAGIGRIESGEYTDEDNVTHPATSCRFAATSNMVIVSNQIEEVQIIYHVIRSLLMSAIDTLTLTGIQNTRLGGADVSLDEEYVPKHTFMRSLSISFEYDIVVPMLLHNHKGGTSINVKAIPEE